MAGATSSTIQNIQRRGWITKKLDRRGGATSLPALTGGPVDRFWTNFRARYAKNIYLHTTGP